MPQDLIAGEDRDALAAEYVLGTLDADERDAARLLLATEEAFASKVRVWERWLGELHLMVEPVEPEPEIWLRIKTKLPPPPETVIALPHIAPEPEPQHAPEPIGAPDAGLEPSSERLPDLETIPAAPKSEISESEAYKSEANKSDKGAEWDFERQIAELRLGVKAAVPAPESVPAKDHLEPPAADGIPSPSPPPGPDLPRSEEVDEAAAGRTPASIEPTASQVVPHPVVPHPAMPHPVVPAAPIRAPSRAPAGDQKLRSVRRRLFRWRATAGVLLLAILAAATLPALWKLAPERVPPKLRPIALMRSIGIPVDTMSGTPREPAPPESQFDE